MDISKIQVNGITYNIKDENLDALVADAPAALDTLKEIADKLGDDDDAIAGLLTAVAGKQDTLVSGTNIKTVNNTSLLGSGDITLPTISIEDEVMVIMSLTTYVNNEVMYI